MRALRAARPPWTPRPPAGVQGCRVRRVRSARSSWHFGVRGAPALSGVDLLARGGPLARCRGYEVGGGGVWSSGQREWEWRGEAWRAAPSARQVRAACADARSALPQRLPRTLQTRRIPHGCGQRATRCNRATGARGTACVAGGMCGRQQGAVGGTTLRNHVNAVRAGGGGTCVGVCGGQLEYTAGGEVSQTSAASAHALPLPQRRLGQAGGGACSANHPSCSEVRPRSRRSASCTAAPPPASRRRHDPESRRWARSWRRGMAALATTCRRVVCVWGWEVGGWFEGRQCPPLPSSLLALTDASQQSLASPKHPPPSRPKHPPHSLPKHPPHSLPTRLDRLVPAVAGVERVEGGAEQRKARGRGHVTQLHPQLGRLKRGWGGGGGE